MNYCGYILNKDIDKEELYRFLREALMKGFIRGPKLFKKDNWKYESMKGGLERFNGIETIFFNDVLVYRANYHGGLIL